MIEKQIVIEGKKQITNPLLKYLNKITEQGKAPKAFGLVHRKTKNEINLQSFFLRESYIDAFSEGIKLDTHLQILNLSRNQLTTNRLIKLILNLPVSLTELNLSNNP
jgi:Ran GTPase-activating protein (RanGAP) involved in mRNA processing and transport